MRLIILASMALTAEAPPAAQTAEPVAPIHSYIRADDYPPDAVRNEEEGTVEFLLTVGVDGQPTDCVVTSSSGSSSLDSATCLIMMERARFRAPKNAAGKPVTANYQSRISWRLESPGPPAVNTATRLWITCASGEVAKLVASELPAAEVGTRAFAACAPLEERIAAEMRKAGNKALDPSKLIPDLKTQIKGQLIEMIESSRADLKGEVSK